jgi:2-hydroxycyclohexanecarboxyl-CoA dehydrogenase
MDLNMNGRTALVTGAGQGIGQTIALHLAAQGVGVGVNDLGAERVQQTVNMIAAAGGRAIAVPFDITDYSQVESALEKIEGELGPLDILVNNAAVNLGHHAFIETTPADWDREIKVCFYGTLNCSHVAAKSMVKRQFGKIVNLASDAGRIGQAREAAYASAKAAIICVAKSLAQELGPFNINVNAVAPAGTDTPMRQELELKELKRLGEEKYRERERKILRLYPLRRIGKAGDVANMVVFLSSDAARHITGQVISVNGGYAMPG